MRRRELSYVINKHKKQEAEGNSVEKADEDTDQSGSTDDEEQSEIDTTLIDENGQWRLEIRETVVNAIGSDYCVPKFYTTGSPNCLRALEGKYECSVPDVVRNYIRKSETETEEAELMEAVDDGLEKIYTDEESLRFLYSSGLSQAQIARRLGCGANTITKWMDHHGILTGEHSEHYSLNGESIDIDLDDVGTDNNDWVMDEDTLRELVDAGLSLSEMADRLNEPAHVIYVQLDRHGIIDK
jgi:DNA-binding transcriptional regulator YiaG